MGTVAYARNRAKITSTADAAHSLHNPVARVSQSINAARIIEFYRSAHHQVIPEINRWDTCL